ncbi:50S ribosomal protein L9 [Candidatus Clavichlamydia salmonicola]|uniref:50S ribosomal protein L9 n=1 Tax=Candidatus Clavichlamydia salmonicola TaxID=469812 RepID=UPI001891CA51|nr:50S ribosomal protein L9 [Candidatus Clavichlamydia salmonicola]MBF5050465.1 50S ribosomal protein L9 [Candidatus Clavichlamydia salmonicola]
MKQHLLLLEDIDGLGRSGDIVTAKPGFIRNYLLPRKKALIAGPATLKMQARLQQQRADKATADRLEAESLVAALKDVIFEIRVKVDSEGHMYGSVGAAELVRVCAEKNITIDRKTVVLNSPIKRLGKHTINLKLKEGILASFALEVLSDLEPEVKAQSDTDAMTEDSLENS